MTPAGIILLLLLSAAPLLHAQTAVPPAWAYVVRPPAEVKPPPPVPAPDWHPADHTPMPAIVARGRQPGVFACAFCHRADGAGGPENASLAGLSSAYMLRQIADFRSGARTGSEPLRMPTTFMVGVARAATDSEIDIAVRYFTAQSLARRILVVESDTAPPVRRLGWILEAAPGAWEKIGQRIIEIPDDPEQFERRDSRARFTAYVPLGSLQRGRAIVESGGGTTTACVTCHGQELRGIDPAPAIAGRSPSYIVRQLYDFKSGSRAGSMSEPMKLVTAQLTLDDMIAAAAYIASLPP